jgi:hypothetical protein
MTPMESIYEIKFAVHDLQRYINSKDAVVSKPEKRNICLHDFDYFFKLLKSTIGHYDLNYGELQWTPED